MITERDTATNAEQGRIRQLEEQMKTLKEELKARSPVTETVSPVFETEHWAASKVPSVQFHPTG